MKNLRQRLRLPGTLYRRFFQLAAFSFLLSNSFVEAASLQSLREKFAPGRLQELEAASKARANRLRALMNIGDSTPLWEQLERRSVVAAAVPGERQMTSAHYMKSLFQNGIQELFRDRNRGTPFVWDPSEFSDEIDAKIKDRRHKICLKHIGGNMERVIENFNVASLREKAANGENLVGGRSREVLAEVQKIGRQYQAIINAQYPELSQVLGHLYDVKVVEGRVEKLRFTKTTANLDRIQDVADRVSVSPDLGMMTTFLLGEDVDFINMQECVLDEIKKRLNEKDESIAKLKAEYVEFRRGAKLSKLYTERARLLRASDYLASRQEGAKVVNRALMSLSQKARFDVFEILLSLQGADLPSEIDLEILDQVALSKNKDLRGEDFEFLKSLSSQLSRLESHFRAYSENYRTYQGLIEQQLK